MINKKAAFTLIEITIVMVILGVLASLALTSSRGVLEKVRSAEGRQILTALLGAQHVIFLETGDYATDPTELEIEILTKPNNFAFPTVSADPLVSIARDTGDYTLSINEDGIISCDDEGGDTCSKIGCPEGVCN